MGMRGGRGLDIKDKKHLFTKTRFRYILSLRTIRGFTETSWKVKSLDSKELQMQLYISYVVLPRYIVGGWYSFLASAQATHIYHIVTLCHVDQCWQNRLFGQIYRLKDLSGKNAAKNAPADLQVNNTEEPLCRFSVHWVLRQAICLCNKRLIESAKEAVPKDRKKV